MRSVSTIKYTENLKLKYKPESDYYLGQTLSRLQVRREKFAIKNLRVATYRLEAKRQIFAIKNLKRASVASGRLLTAQISLLISS